MCLNIFNRARPQQEPPRIRLVPLNDDPRTVIAAPRRSPVAVDGYAAPERPIASTPGARSARDVHVADTLRTLETPRSPAPTRRQMEATNTPRGSSGALATPQYAGTEPRPPVSHFSTTTASSASLPQGARWYSSVNNVSAPSHRSAGGEGPRSMGHRPPTGLHHPRPVLPAATDLARMSRHIHDDELAQAAVTHTVRH